MWNLHVFGVTVRTDLIAKTTPIGSDDRRSPVLSIEPLRVFLAAPEVYENSGF